MRFQPNNFGHFMAKTGISNFWILISRRADMSPFHKPCDWRAFGCTCTFCHGVRAWYDAPADGIWPHIASAPQGAVAMMASTGCIRPRVLLCSLTVTASMHAFVMGVHASNIFTSSDTFWVMWYFVNPWGMCRHRLSCQMRLYTISTSKKQAKFLVASHVFQFEISDLFIAAAALQCIIPCVHARAVRFDGLQM